MAHVHNESIVIRVSKLAKGDAGDCCMTCELSGETMEQLEAVVRELLGDPSLVVEIEHNHDNG